MGAYRAIGGAAHIAPPYPNLIVSPPLTAGYDCRMPKTQGWEYFPQGGLRGSEAAHIHRRRAGDSAQDPLPR